MLLCRILVMWFVVTHKISLTHSIMVFSLSYAPGNKHWTQYPLFFSSWNLSLGAISTNFRQVRYCTIFCSFWSICCNMLLSFLKKTTLSFHTWVTSEMSVISSNMPFFFICLLLSCFLTCFKLITSVAELEYLSHIQSKIALVLTNMKIFLIFVPSITPISKTNNSW